MRPRDKDGRRLVDTNQATAQEVDGAADKSTIPDAADDMPQQQRSSLPQARATAYPPSGQRSRYLVVVPRCPRCYGAHHHYASDIQSLVGATKSGCGRPYRLALTRLMTGGGGHG